MIPSQTDIDWFNNLFSCLKDQATWVWPAAGVSFRVDKTSKNFVIVEEPPIFKESLAEDYITSVATTMGWQVIRNNEAIEVPERPEVINPITFRGSHSINLSIGRLW